MRQEGAFDAAELLQAKVCSLVQQPGHVMTIAIPY